MKFKVVLLSLLMVVLTGCGSDENVKKDEEYQFANGLMLLEVPPDLTRPDKNLVMEISKPSQRACEILMEADKKFKQKKAEQK